MRLDGGGWHGFGLQWVSAAESYWLSADADIGSLTAGGHTLQIDASFQAGDPLGLYAAMVYFGARSCGSNLGNGLLGVGLDQAGPPLNGGTARPKSGAGQPTTGGQPRTPALPLSTPSPAPVSASTPPTTLPSSITANTTPSRPAPVPLPASSIHRPTAVPALTVALAGTLVAAFGVLTFLRRRARQAATTSSVAGEPPITGKRLPPFFGRRWTGWVGPLFGRHPRGQ